MSGDERKEYCLPLDRVGLDDIPWVGGKTASLGEMIQQLSAIGVAVPGGFAVTSAAYDAILDRFQLRERLKLLLDGVDVTDLDDLSDRGFQARQMVLNAGLPEAVKDQVIASYKALSQDGEKVSVAVRSSATAEDLPTASFAGQQATFLNVQGSASVAIAVLECLASVFTDRAIAYRVHNNFDHMDIKGAVAVQRMVRSDLASSGVAFTLDPDTGFRDVVVITGSYGLGESVVGGKVDPDEVQVFKPMIGKAEDPIIRRRIGRKQTQMVYSREQRTKTIDTTEADQAKRCFSDEDSKILAKWCVDIENHYSKKHGHSTPMDIEWAKDGITGELFVVQARPETVRSRQKEGCLTSVSVAGHGPEVIEGVAIGSDAACGKARVITDLAAIATMKPGEILIADMTDPDWVPAIRIASAVVTNRGGRTCHAAIVSRELGVPCIVGTKDATERLKTGETYTIDCSTGSRGLVYHGMSDIVRTEIDISDLPDTDTKIQLILGDPDSALTHASLPVKGVGLVRQEFVVANHIGIHPNAVLKPDLVKEADWALISERAINDPSPVDFFIRKLAEGIGSIGAAFYPRPIIVRLGDFKSNEYCRLIGGQNFEPEEENPMIGLRGASRYLHPDFRESFELECRALSHVRNQMCLDNVHLMVPFCRTPEEGKGVIQTLADQGLVQGENGLKIWVMCEIPSNVLAVDEFAQVFDGFSIGSNDLTQLVLGVDRDSSELTNLFDESNIAVKRAIAMAIQGAHRHDRPIGLCGQAPSDNPVFAEFLVGEGIDSISVTPDSVIPVLRVVADAERKKANVSK
jgi:pyruvate,water dikinase